MLKALLLTVAAVMISCSSTPPSEPVTVAIQAPVQVPQGVAPAVAPASEPPKVLVEAPKPEKVPAEPGKSKPADQVAKIKKGKVAGGQPAPKLISQMKNPKTPGVTTEKCWNYGGQFAIVEMKSTDEIGSAELTLRLGGPEVKGLCATEYNGPKKDLRIIEGHFAGVIGEWIVVDGEDATEGLFDFQVFNLQGKEVYKAKRHPEQDLVIAVKNGVTSLTYFAPVTVRCELAADGEECWKKTVAANKLPKTAMPDCKGIFEKSKTALTEAALVTTKATVSDVSQPKLKFLGGSATCAPAP